MADPAPCLDETYHRESFPQGSVLHKLENRIITVNGIEIRLRKILSEVYARGYEERKAVFDAERVKGGGFLRIDMRVQCDPFLLQDGKVPTGRYCTAFFHREAGIWRTLSSSGNTPQYITHAEMKQDDDIYEYRGGYLNILVLEWYTEVPLSKAVLNLPREQVDDLKLQIDHLFQYVSKAGWEYTGNENDFHYHLQRKKVLATNAKLFGPIQFSKPSLLKRLSNFKEPTEKRLHDLKKFVDKNTSKAIPLLTDQYKEALKASRYEAELMGQGAF